MPAIERTPQRYTRYPSARVTTASEVRQDRSGFGPKRAGPTGGATARGTSFEDPRIRDRYRDIILSFAGKEGSDKQDHVISENVTQTQCIGYAQRYIVGGETHYRYDRYRERLKTCVQNVPFDQSVPTVMHLDLGAGPGLFTWAFWDLMHDEMGEDRWPSLDLFGYDHAPQMAALARRIWDRLELQTPYRCFDSEEEAYANVWPQGPRTNILITLGHSLIQVHEHGGLAVFAGLCEAIAGLDRNARLVAVDAHSGDRVNQFDTAWRKLVSMMANSRVTVIHEAESLRVATVKLVSGPWRRR